LRYAIFAFSSCHLDRRDSSDVTEALQYYNCCLELLIPVLSGAREHITEDILAAVAILRQHEEMDGQSSNADKQHASINAHTFQGRTINSISLVQLIS
jgi:hypothetical protein